MAFSRFYPLDDLATPTISGEFNFGWNTKYVRSMPDAGGVGLKIHHVRMHQKLPEDIAHIANQPELVYAIVSCRYPILYVGITYDNLATGFFGRGRFTHHLRKFMASCNSGTSHPAGWQAHAVERYTDAMQAITSGKDFCQWADLRIAVASIKDPENHEGYVLEQFMELVKRIHPNKEVTILNSRGTISQHIDMNMPSNVLTLCQDIQPIGVGAVPIQGKDLDVDPADAEEITAPSNADYREYFAGPSDDAYKIFLRILKWARSLDISSWCEEKIIKGYSNQPKGYNSTRLLCLTPVGLKGQAVKGKWICRIPLGDGKPMTVILPSRALQPQAEAAGLIERGTDANFRPTSIENFLEKPQFYTDLA